MVFLLVLCSGSSLICWVLIGFFYSRLYALLSTRRFGELIASLLMVVTGFVIVTAPVLLYFHGHNALDDLYTYFYCNIFLYNSGSKLLIPVYFVFNTLKNIGQNIVLFPVMVLNLQICFDKQIFKEQDRKKISACHLCHFISGSNLFQCMVRLLPFNSDRLYGVWSYCSI